VAAVAAVTLWPTYPTSRIRQAVGDSLVAAARLVAGPRPLCPDASQEQADARMRDLVAADETLAKGPRRQACTPRVATGVSCS